MGDHRPALPRRRGGRRTSRPSAGAAARTGPTGRRPPRPCSGSRGRAPPRRHRAGGFVSSAAQSRKLDRKPCGTAPISRSLRSFENIMSDSRFPRTPGKMSAPPLPSVRAASRICAARRDSETRCSRLAFMRVAGIVQTRPLRSISSHVASRTSPDRDGPDHSTPAAMSPVQRWTTNTRSSVMMRKIAPATAP